MTYYTYNCRGCGRESTVNAPDEGQNTTGIHVRCGVCKTTNFAAKERAAVEGGDA